jgi:DTW domain-containing protein YfiP
MGLLRDPNEVAVLVFPHEDALELEDGLRLAEGRCKSNNIDMSNDAKEEEKKKMTLIFIDATWKYAKEMEKCTDSDNQWPENLIRVRITPPSSTSTSSSSSSSSSLSKVNLDGSDDDGWKTPSLTTTPTTTTTTTTTTTPFIERRFHIRTPPSSNHLCTAESIAWIVSRVERNPVIYESIMTALDYMVSVWN